MREKGVLRMDTIQIKGLRIFAYHGVGPGGEEGRPAFVLDIAMKADLSRARRSDDLEDTVNYAAVVEAVRAAFTAQSYDLIERAGPGRVRRRAGGLPPGARGAGPFEKAGGACLRGI